MFELEKSFIIIMAVAIILVIGVIAPLIVDDMNPHETREYTILNKRIDRGYGTSFILVTNDGEFVVSERTYDKTHINDTLLVTYSQSQRVSSIEVQHA